MGIAAYIVLALGYGLAMAMFMSYFIWICQQQRPRGPNGCKQQTGSQVGNKQQTANKTENNKQAEDSKQIEEILIRIVYLESVILPFRGERVRVNQFPP